MAYSAGGGAYTYSTAEAPPGYNASKYYARSCPRKNKISQYIPLKYSEVDPDPCQ